MNTDIIMNNTSTPTGNNNNYVAVKVTRGAEMRRFQFTGKTFQEIKDTVSQLFGIPLDDFTLQYEDDEKDRVTLSSDAELNEAIKLHKYVLRFYVVNKSAPNPAAATFALPPPFVPAQGLPFFPPPPSPIHASAPPPPVVVIADGEVASPASPPHHPHPHPPHHGHHGHRGHHGHGPHHGGMMRGGRHGFPGGHPHHGPHDHHHHGHGPHHEHHHKNKRHLDKEERAAWKLEKKRFKKQRKCEKESSSSSSSSEEDAQKVLRKEMKQLMKATKQQIKKNWAATKDANPAQWPENKKLMIAEIKAAKKLIREQVYNPNALVPVEQNVTTASNVATEMQA